MIFLMSPRIDFTQASACFPDLMQTILETWETRAFEGTLPFFHPPRQPYPAGPEWEHWHLNPEIFLILQGTNHFALPETSLEAPAGSLVVIPGFNAHREKFHRERGEYAHICISLSGHTLTSHLAILARNKAVHDHVAALSLQDPTIPFVIRVLDELARQNGSAHPRPRTRNALVLTLITHLRECFRQPAADRAISLSAACRHLISRRLHEPGLSVAQIAETLGCHPDHLSRLYHRETGQPLRQHIIEQRLRLAEQLLVTTRIPIHEVARLSGHTDPAYFTLRFRRRTGKTPTDYRAIHRPSRP